MLGRKIGRYQLIDSLGSGTMGTVFLGRNCQTQEKVAIKVVRTNVLFDRERRERFLRNMLTVTQIAHPGLCPILDIGDEGDDFFVVMPLLRGKTLGLRYRGISLTCTRVLEIGLAVAEVLAAGHSMGAVHRGLKPANIWIQEDESMLLLDFGMARFTEIQAGGTIQREGKAPEFADTIIPLKALAYMSPEQVRGESVDLRSDIFSLGVILYELLSGRHPFESRNSLSRISAILEGSPPPLSRMNGEVRPRISDLVGQMMEKSPEGRLPSMEAVLGSMREIRDLGLCTS